MTMKRWFCALLCMILLVTSMPCLAETANRPQVGDHFLFGRWEQDNDDTNGYEPLEWFVVDEDGDRLFVMTYRCIEVAIFYHKRVSRYWGNSTLREWMNSIWIDQLFTPEEKSHILLTTVTNTNPHSVPGAGDDTLDYIYLMSRKECMQYFPEQEDRVAWPTAHAVAQGCTVSKKTGSTRWWLRTPGARKCDIQGIRIDGRYTSYGMQDVDWPTNCLRPVMWITWDEDLAERIVPVEAETVQ